MRFPRISVSGITLLTISCLTAITNAQTLATDDFSSGTLSGGSGWSNSWNTGVISSQRLLFDGSSSQNASRNYSGLGTTFDPRPISNANGAYAGFYSVQYELGVDITANNMNNYGFRMFQGGNNNGGSFVGVWKSDYNSGRLTFLGSNNGDFAIAPTFALDSMNNSYDVWNITAGQNSASNGISYLFTYDVSVVHGQNPSQFKGGSYDVQVIRLDNGTTTHTAMIDSIGWRDSNDLNISPLESITFQNTNNRTNLFIDDVKISTVSQMIPEPSSSSLAITGLSALAFLRRRAK